ncbi:tetratricopeptide repeat protein [Saccharothrix sp. NRRL B-16348]|uniref:tetratricopeptide repeat protein n=1 Tax=Saccharothrix sp. NRRL B-16348 TaxID=1415542 RepID=UPI0006AE83BD|nr:hypothetical protein [Saccharothrix sp. NRRL B-16348]
MRGRKDDHEDLATPGITQNAAASGGSVVVQAAGDVYLTAVPPSGPVGVPLEQVVDPYAVEVHRSITLDEGQLPGLPVYVPRAHDEQLREVVEQAVGGRSAIAVLTAGSAAGKTRACWEALAPLRAAGGWRLWHPQSPTRAQAALAGLDRVGPRTVVWLNETQEYLGASGDRGERVVGMLRALLSDPRRAPVLVLGTLWREHHNDLTREPGSQTTALLAGHVIRVPDMFEDVDLPALAQAAKADPRLAWARQHAAGRQVTQSLAGAPELLDRWRTAPRAAEAVLRTAVDAWRLGYPEALSAQLLSQGALAYLNDVEVDQLGEDWLERTLDYATRPCKGAPGPLIRHRTGTDRAPLYKLHDYLCQQGTRDRERERCPAGLWDALVEHTTDVDHLVALAEQAQQRGLYSLAARLADRALRVASDGRAAVSGTARAMRLLGWLHERRGATTESAAWHARADGLDPPLRLDSLWLWHDLAEDEDDLRDRSVAGDRGAMMVLADRLMATHVEEALLWARRAAEAGESEPVLRLADALQDAYRTDEAKQVLTSQAEAGNLGAMWRLAQLLTAQGETEEAFHWIRAHGETGDPLAVSKLAAALQRRGDRNGAEELLRRHAEAGATPLMWHLGEFLVRHGDLDEAITWFQRSAAEDLMAERLILDKCRALGRVADAEPPLRAQHDKGNWSATGRLAEALVLLGRHDEAELLLRWLVEATTDTSTMMGIAEPDGMPQLIDLLDATGRGAEAARLRRYGIEPGGKTAVAFDLPEAT